ncbi:MAG: glutaredoxin domain-containing protein [Ilumatobacteraceae bacterium]
MPYTSATNGGRVDADADIDCDAGITVYWRPGCGFCKGLFHQLDRLEVTYSRVDIWSDPAGAAFVRSVARGNETVPTVAVGPVAMVNPTVRQILDAATEHAPDVVPAGYESTAWHRR